MKCNELLKCMFVGVCGSIMSAPVVSAWAETIGPQRKLTASDAEQNDLFGSSVSVHENIALVGALGDDDKGFFDVGSAYLFNVETGKQLHKLTPDLPRGEFFGTSVSTDVRWPINGGFQVKPGRYPAKESYNVQSQAYEVPIPSDDPA